MYSGLPRQRARADRGANLDVIFPWHVSVWMRASTVDGHSLPLSRRGRIIVPTGPLAVLHLDVVKRWGCDGSGFEPHRTGDVSVGGSYSVIKGRWMSGVRADGGRSCRKQRAWCRVSPGRRLLRSRWRGNHPRLGFVVPFSCRTRYSQWIIGGEFVLRIDSAVLKTEVEFTADVDLCIFMTPMI